MTPKELVRKWVEIFNAGDANALAELYHEEAMNHQVANEPVVGKEAILQMFINEFEQADMVCLVENIFEEGEWAILEWKDPLGLRGCGFFHVVEGKIKLQRGYWDKLNFLRQHNLPLPKK
ncbi:MAG: nuclear transport factor 2 family protein [Cyclobacteriaceae bacterium]|nr:nuclear transport factor 2 family protein [Cyclobacteriaceae bacterium]